MTADEPMIVTRSGDVVPLSTWDGTHSDGMNEHEQLRELVIENHRLRSALKWVRMNAGLHYMGGAFDPEHMRSLAELATNALNGDPVDDFDEAMERGKAKAAEWAAIFRDEAPT